MLKKTFFIILLLNLLNHCDYKPVYSDKNKINYKIVITSFSGDKDINNLIATNLKKTSKKGSDKIINIVFDTKYTKNDYQTDVVTTFVIENENNSESFSVNERFNFKKMNDKYEEKNYERNIKENLANSISQKLILRLAVIK